MGCGASSATAVSGEHKAVMKKKKKSHEVKLLFLDAPELENLPEECKNLVVESKLKEKEILANIPTLLNCLKILTGKSFLVEEGQQKETSTSSDNFKEPATDSANAAANDGDGFLAATIVESSPKERRGSAKKLPPLAGSELAKQRAEEKDLFSSENPLTLFFKEGKIESKIPIKGFLETYVVTLDKENIRATLKFVPMERRLELMDQILELKNFQHPNLVEFVRKNLYINNERIWVVMESGEGSSLNNLIQNLVLSDKELAYICKQILLALVYIHEKGYAHKDLRPENILLYRDGTLKLGFFSVGERDIGRYDNKYYRYLAPENISNPDINVSKFACDVWQLGCLLFEIVEGKPPRKKDTNLKALFQTATHKSVTLKKSSKYPRGELIQVFLNKCFVPDPSKRPTVRELLEDPFILSAAPAEQLSAELKNIFLKEQLQETMMGELFDMDDIKHRGRSKSIAYEAEMAKQ